MYQYLTPALVCSLILVGREKHRPTGIISQSASFGTEYMRDANIHG